MLQNIDVLFEGGKVVEIVRYYSSKVWWQLWQESVLLVCTRRRDSTRQSQQEPARHFRSSALPHKETIGIHRGARIW